MKIYLNGVEYKAYREILKKFNIKYGCLNYEYIWSRTPMFNLEEETEFLDELIVDPGQLRPVYMDEYIEYLNEHADIISFALELYSPKREMLKMDCDVEIIPYMFSNTNYQKVVVKPSEFIQPFVRQRTKKLNELGIKVHGINCELPFFDSINTSTWMRGKAGWISYYDMKDRIQVFPPWEKHKRTAIARKLIVEGYKLNLNKIKEDEWKEVAKMNCVTWKKYSDYMEGK